MPGKKPLLFLLAEIVVLYGLIGVIIYVQSPTLPAAPRGQLYLALEEGNLSVASAQGAIVGPNDVTWYLKNGREYETPESDRSNILGLFDTFHYTNYEENTGIPLSTLLLIIIPTLLILIILGIFFWQTGAFGSKKPKNLSTHYSQKPNTRFTDIAGIKEAKIEIQEVVDFLKNPARFQNVGARIPKGVLLVGPPGTGKTLLARAVAGEANCGFYAFSGSSFVEVFVGLGAARIRKLFKEAKRRSPAIIFIDELDALGRTRGGSLHFPGSEERENTLNQLLVEMDGFEPSSKLVIIAATNRPDVLDSALTRPGRFDREITIDLPDLKSREEILNLHKNGKPFDTSISFQGLASQTAGLSGADLANLLNEAAIQAARQNELIITKLHLEKALDRILMGSERPEVLSNPKEKNQVAVHEIGHALVMSLLPNPTPLHKVNLVSRGKALGATIPIGKDQQLATYSELQNRLASLLAGRAAEELTFGKDSISTSAADDLERASQLAKDMITKFGMGSTLQTISDSNLQEQRVYQEQIESLLKTAFEKSTSLLQEHKDKLASLSALLQEKETLEGGEFQALLS